jgi:hypothetical protein
MSIYDLMTIDLPEGELNGLRVDRFEVGKDDLENLRNALDARGTMPGTYIRLCQQSPNGGWWLWMSDTDAEKRDHFEAAYQIHDRGGRVLIGGLGLGMILRVALLTDGVTHVDVVEINETVIELVGPHYEKMAADRGVSLTIHHDDMFSIKWPRGTRWDVVWIDVWSDVTTDDLEVMARLRRSYGQRSNWNDCWGRHMLLRYRGW